MAFKRRMLHLFLQGGLTLHHDTDQKRTREKKEQKIKKRVMKKA